MTYTYREHIRNIVIGTLAGLLSGGFWIVYDQWKDKGELAFLVPLFLIIIYAILIIPISWVILRERKLNKKI